MSDLAERVRALLRPEIFSLTAYQVPDARGLLKLDAMENPYSWPPEMIDEWLERLREAAINRYPDPAAAGLKSALRQTNDIPDAADILLGNGSDELIQIILMALAGTDAVVLAPEPSFVMYRLLAVSQGLRYVGVPLRGDDFGLDMEAVRAVIRRHRPAVVFLAYPNNPTGNLFAEEEMLEILAISPGLVVIDEAYAPFAEAGFMARLARQDRLLVMRTLSKLGLAGLRLGFLAGAPAWLEQFEKLRLPYNINVLTQISAEFALARESVFATQVRQILEQREYLSTALRHLGGVRAYPSKANFILFRLLHRDAGEVFNSLKRCGILIKNLHPAGGLLNQCLRVTVGTPEENQRFLDALGAILDG